MKLVNILNVCLTINAHRIIAALLVVLYSISIIPASLAQEAAPQSGKELFKSGKFADALSCFDKDVDEKPTDGTAHFWRAKCLLSLGRVKEATAEYKLALLLSGDNSIKEQCKVALKNNNQVIPAGSVMSGSGVESSDKTFKLSTRKLDWNIKTDELQGTVKTQDARLASAVNGGGTSLLEKMIGRRSSMFNSGAMAEEIRTAVPHASFKLKEADLATLKNSDVYIIQDQSGSMGVPDCPGGSRPQSRLNWSVEELNGFADSLCRILPHGFVFMSFNTEPNAHVVNDSRSFMNYLHDLRSEGGTSLAPALNLAFRSHQAHLNQPMLIAVVTDGLIDVDDVKALIASATKRFYLPNGVFVTFAQVGVSADIDGQPDIDDAGQRLDDLNNLQKTSGAAYDAVEIVRFRELREEGLGKSILKALRKYIPEPKPQPHPVANSLLKKKKLD